MLRHQSETSTPWLPGVHARSVFYSLGILAFQATSPSEPTTAIILDHADFIVCMIFLADFLISLFRAEDRWRYPRTWAGLICCRRFRRSTLFAGAEPRAVRMLRILLGLRATQLMAGLVMLCDLPSRARLSPAYASSDQHRPGQGTRLRCGGFAAVCVGSATRFSNVAISAFPFG